MHVHVHVHVHVRVRVHVRVHVHVHMNMNMFVLQASPMCAAMLTELEGRGAAERPGSHTHRRTHRMIAAS